MLNDGVDWGWLVDGTLKPLRDMGAWELGVDEADDPLKNEDGITTDREGRSQAVLGDGLSQESGVSEVDLGSECAGECVGSTLVARRGRHDQDRNKQLASDRARLGCWRS